MKLKFGIICNNAFVDEIGSLSIIQIFDIIKATNFPAIHSKLSIVTRWELENRTEKRSSHEYQLNIIDETNNKKIIEIPKRKLMAEEDRDEYLQFVNNITGLKFDHEGSYKINIILDNKVYKKVIEFKVIKE